MWLVLGYVDRYNRKFARFTKLRMSGNENAKEFDVNDFDDIQDFHLTVKACLDIWNNTLEADRKCLNWYMFFVMSDDFREVQDIFLRMSNCDYFNDEQKKLINDTVTIAQTASLMYRYEPAVDQSILNVFPVVDNIQDKQAHDNMCLTMVRKFANCVDTLKTNFNVSIFVKRAAGIDPLQDRKVISPFITLAEVKDLVEIHDEMKLLDFNMLFSSELLSLFDVRAMKVIRYMFEHDDTKAIAEDIMGMMRKLRLGNGFDDIVKFDAFAFLIDYHMSNGNTDQYKLCKQQLEQLVDDEKKRLKRSYDDFKSEDNHEGMRTVKKRIQLCDVAQDRLMFW